MSTELASPVLNVDKCSVLLLDIAGTTTSNTFLKVIYSYYLFLLFKIVYTVIECIDFRNSVALCFFLLFSIAVFGAYFLEKI